MRARNRTGELSDKRQIYCSPTDLAAGGILSSLGKNLAKMGFAELTRNALSLGFERG
jgi:hypothetical protein